MLSQWTPLTTQLTRARVLQHVAQAGGGFRLEPKWPHTLSLSLSLSYFLSLFPSFSIYIPIYISLCLYSFFLQGLGVVHATLRPSVSIPLSLSLSVSQRGRHASLRWLAAGFPMIDDARKF